MNKNAISVENSLAEKHPQVNNQHNEDSTQNQYNSAKSVNVINHVKMTSVVPTALYISLFSSLSL
jgi:hypothetical protein